MKHFNKAANGTAANHRQVDITLQESDIRNINVKINDNHKMTAYLIPGSLIRKYFNIIKTFPDYGTVIKVAIVNVTDIEKNIVTIPKYIG